jgi:hypothetical protein
MPAKSTGFDWSMVWDDLVVLAILPGGQTHMRTSLAHEGIAEERRAFASSGPVTSRGIFIEQELRL